MSDAIFRFKNDKARAVVVVCPNEAVNGMADGEPAAMVLIPGPLTPELDNKYVIAIGNETLDRICEHKGDREGIRVVLDMARNLLDCAVETA